MKKFIAYIFAFYILFSAVVPCSLFDDCRNEQQAEQTADPAPIKDCTSCSPFSTCAFANGFTVCSEVMTLQPLVLDSAEAFLPHSSPTIAGYCFTHFQPPRARLLS